MLVRGKHEKILSIKSSGSALQFTSSSMCPSVNPEMDACRSITGLLVLVFLHAKLGIRSHPVNIDTTPTILNSNLLEKILNLFSLIKQAKP
eukprot:Gb_06111 [translate_table: standard]